MTSPPQAAPPAIGLGLPLALSAMMWMVLSHITSPLAPCSLGSFLRRLTIRCSSVCTARLGVQPPRRVEPPQTIRAHIRFVGLVCERLHSLGEASLLRSLVLHPGHSAQAVFSTCDTRFLWSLSMWVLV